MLSDYARSYRTLYEQHWWWRARERILLDVLRALLLPDRPRVLDVGCGDALFFPALRGLLHPSELRGIEVDTGLLDPEGLDRERIGTEPLGSDVYEDWRFDLITALDVVEHIEDDAAAIADMVRMLDPGGHLVITVPAFMSLWSAHDEVNLHHRRYRRGQLRGLLQPHGEIVRLRYLFHALYPPKRLIAAIERRRQGSAGADGNRAAVRQHALPTGAVNGLLAALCYWESRLPLGARIPFGSSLLAVVRVR